MASPAAGVLLVVIIVLASVELRPAPVTPRLACVRLSHLSPSWWLGIFCMSPPLSLSIRVVRNFIETSTENRPRSFDVSPVASSGACMTNT